MTASDPLDPYWDEIFDDSGLDPCPPRSVAPEPSDGPPDALPPGWLDLGYVREDGVSITAPVESRPA